MNVEATNGTTHIHKTLKHGKPEAESSEMELIDLRGNWTIERAGELRQILLDAVTSNDNTVIDLENTTHIDLACLQLLCSAHRTSLNMQKDLAFSENKSESLRETVREAGFIRIVGCHKDPSKTCLWKGEWE